VEAKQQLQGDKVVSLIPVAHSPTPKIRRNTKTGSLAGRLSVARLTFSTSFKFKRPKVKVNKPFNADTKIQQYLRNGKAY